MFEFLSNDLTWRWILGIAIVLGYVFIILVPEVFDHVGLARLWNRTKESER